MYVRDMYVLAAEHQSLSSVDDNLVKNRLLFAFDCIYRTNKLMVSVTDFSSKKTQAYQAQGRVKNSLHRNNEQENR